MDSADTPDTLHGPALVLGRAFGRSPEWAAWVIAGATRRERLDKAFSDAFNSRAARQLAAAASEAELAMRTFSRAVIKESLNKPLSDGLEHRPSTWRGPAGTPGARRMRRQRKAGNKLARRQRRINRLRS